MTRHALDGVAAEQILAVFDIAIQDALAVCQVQGQVHVRGLHRHLPPRPLLLGVLSLISQQWSI